MASMPTTEEQYFAIRQEFLEEDQEAIIAAEQKYMDFLLNVTLDAAQSIHDDFTRAMELSPFWVNYPPRQRGRAPTGESIPWGEVGEKTIMSNLVRAISLKDPSITFPGLPFGGDVRFATSDVLIHFDIKLTGPNDNPNEIVASPNQISGDGAHWRNGVLNAPHQVVGQKAVMDFQPELPPFYILGGRTLLCLTYFLKAIYVVQGLGVQPLDYLELACVPNGLLLFGGPRLAQTRGLLIPGKDEKTFVKKRTRVRLDPLAILSDWRCIEIRLIEGEWQTSLRASHDQSVII
jgi:Restriction endonuclease BglI